jgi:hypothetical protein
VARLGEQLLRPDRVAREGVPGLVGVAEKRRRRGDVGGYGLAVVDLRHDGVAVDRKRDGLADPLVAEERVAGVEGHEVKGVARRGVHPDPGRVLEGGDVLVVQGEDDVDVARAEQVLAHEVVRNDLEGDLIEIGEALAPVVREAAEHDLAALAPLDELERPRADRIALVLGAPHLLERLLADHTPAADGSE